jgi:beta-glucosidase
VVQDPALADIAVLRITTAAQNRPNSFFGAYLKEGPLSFDATNEDRIAVERAAEAGHPVIVVAHLDRAAVLGAIVDRADGLIVDFGASDDAVFDVVTGRFPIRGRLPYELPSSDAAVETQLPDVPDDSADPLFRRGFGLDLG